MPGLGGTQGTYTSGLDVDGILVDSDGLEVREAVSAAVPPLCLHPGRPTETRGYGRCRTNTRTCAATAGTGSGPDAGQDKQEDL